MLGIHTWGKSNVVLKSGQVVDNLLKFLQTYMYICNTIASILFFILFYIKQPQIFQTFFINYDEIIIRRKKVSENSSL